MLFKNWPAICNAHPALRLLLVTCEDEAVFAKLKLGFPELFAAEPMSEPRIPLSVIQNTAEETSRRDFDSETYARTAREFELNEACDRFHIPVVYWSADNPVLAEIRDQLVRQTAKAGHLRVIFRGEEFLVTQIDAGVKDIEQVLTRGRVARMKFVCIAPIRFFILDE